MKYIILLLLIVIAGKNHAQAPGYLGKRFSVDGDVNLLLRMGAASLNHKKRRAFVYDANSQTYESKLVDNPKRKYFKFNLNSGVSLNYTISRKAEASLNFNFIRGNVIFPSSSEFSTKKGAVPYFTREASVNLRFYRRNFIAPIGKYIIVGFGRSISSSLKDGYVVQYLERKTINNQTVEEYKEAVSHFTIKLNKLTIGFGEKRTFKKFFVKYEFQYNNYFLFRLLRYRYIGKGSSFYVFRKNLNYDNFINLKVGIGMMF